MRIPTRTQVGIVGAGPAGLLLARLLARKGIDVVVLERQSQKYVEGRIRAGVLEQGTAAVLRRAGAAERMDAECLLHEGIGISFDGRVERVDFRKYAGNSVIVYGQTEITKDLNRLNAADGITIFFEAQVESIAEIDGDSPQITVTHAGKTSSLRCDFVAGCDGFHGVSRRSIPDAVLREHEKVYPYGWLGVLSDSRPADEELIYANHQRGFALCSQRSRTVSRNYIQVDATDDVAAWDDQRFWDELRRRLPDNVAETLDTGRSTEKSIAQLRSFVAEPMRCGALFLVGDAAHIVPPTGAKGLNLAVSDAWMLSSALLAWYEQKDAIGLDRYSKIALDRVWASERFSWWFTMATHRMSENSFDQNMQLSDLNYATGTELGLRTLAENYVGPPIVDPVTGDSL